MFTPLLYYPLEQLDSAVQAPFTNASHAEVELHAHFVSWSVKDDAHAVQPDLSQAVQF